MESNVKDNYNLAVGCFVIRHGGVLLVRHTYGSARGKLLIPGGFCRSGELPEAAAAMESALRLLRSGGVIFVSFISLYAGLSYFMKDAPAMVLGEGEYDYLDCCTSGRDYAGDGFTKVFFINPDNIIPFVSRFPLERLNLFGQEGIASPGENNIMASGEESIQKWIEICYSLCEREGLLSFSEHPMFVGRKTL